MAPKIVLLTGEKSRRRKFINIFNKKMNKKTIGGLILSAAVFLLMPVLALAQSASDQPASARLPLVEITKINLEKNSVDAGSNIAGTFTLKNQSAESLSDLRYKVRLYEKPVGDTGQGYIDNSPTIPITTQIAPDTIIVGSNEEKSVKFNFSVPKNIISGEHMIIIEVFQASGTRLNWESTKINISNGAGKYTTISNQELLVNGEAAESPIEGVTVKPEDKIEVVFSVDNAPKIEKAKIVTQVFYRDTLSQKLKDETQDIVLTAGKNKIRFELPKMEKPGGSYLARIQLVDPQTNDILSNEVFFRWVIGGVSAKILSVSLLNQPAENLGANIPLSIVYAGPADMRSDGGTAKLSIDVKNNGNTVGSDSQDVKLADPTTVIANVDISGGAKNIDATGKFDAEIKILKDGQVLDSYIFSIPLDRLSLQIENAKKINAASAGSTAGFFSNTRNILPAIALFPLLVLAIYFLIKKKKPVYLAIFAVIIIIAAMLILSARKGETAVGVRDYCNPGYYDCRRMSLAAAYSGYAINADTFLGGCRLRTQVSYFMTDEPITFHNPANTTLLYADMGSVNYHWFYRTDTTDFHANSINFDLLIPAGGINGRFTGTNRYLYALFMERTGQGVYSVMHVELPNPPIDFQIQKFFYWHCADSTPQTIVTDWYYPLFEESHAPESDLRYKGTFQTLACANGRAASINKLAFYVSQDEFQFSITGFPNSETGVVVPSSLVGQNYIKLGEKNNLRIYRHDVGDYADYDIIFTKNAVGGTGFPVGGNSGSVPGIWNSSNLYAYIIAYGPTLATNYITNISDIPVRYTAPMSTLSLTKSGAGTGTVTSAPAGISCDASCPSASAAFSQGTSVTLSAGAVIGSTFSGWSGACAGSNSSCAVLMDNSKSVNAKFDTCVPDGTYTCIKSPSDCAGQPCGTMGTSVCLDFCGQAVSTSLCGNCDPVVCPPCSSDNWREVAP